MITNVNRHAKFDWFLRFFQVLKIKISPSIKIGDFKFEH
jgi:hypothetical protein